LILNVSLVLPFKAVLTVEKTNNGFTPYFDKIFPTDAGKEI